MRQSNYDDKVLCNFNDTAAFNTLLLNIVEITIFNLSVP